MSSLHNCKTQRERLMSKRKPLSSCLQKHWKLHLTSCRMLQDLPMQEDAAWTYFDSQHKWIMKQMNTAYETSAKAVDAALETTITDSADPDTLPNLLAVQIHASLTALEKKQSDDVVGMQMISLLPKLCLPSCSTIRWRPCLGIHCRTRQEHIRGHAVISAQLLENIHQLYQWEIQEGRHTAVHMNTPSCRTLELQLKTKPDPVPLDGARRYQVVHCTCIALLHAFRHGCALSFTHNFPTPYAAEQ